MKHNIHESKYMKHTYYIVLHYSILKCTFHAKRAPHISQNPNLFPVHYRIFHSILTGKPACLINISPHYVINNQTYWKCLQTCIRCKGCLDGSEVLERYRRWFNTLSMQYTQNSRRPGSYLSTLRNHLQTQNHFYKFVSLFFNRTRQLNTQN